jgi:hypothetical protein
LATVSPTYSGRVTAGFRFNPKRGHMNQLPCLLFKRGDLRSDYSGHVS